MTNTKTIYTFCIQHALLEILCDFNYDRIFVITDSNVAREIIPSLRPALERMGADIIIFPAGEENKNLETAACVWRALSEKGATRRSMIINIGGGVVTDLGGFAAATFKRGIRHINIPTTLLGAVDAAVGGKTGIDLDSLKNEIGAFRQPEAVIVSAEPLATLPADQILSGYAEIMKMALLCSKELYYKLLEADLTADNPNIPELMRFAISKKQEIVEADPFESDLRRILNLGHTAGHAFETLMLERGTPVTHGAAVAHGIHVAWILSHLRYGTDPICISQYRNSFLQPNYPALPLSCPDVDALVEIMRHDKKRNGDAFTFILPSAPGQWHIDTEIPEADVRAALEIKIEG